MIDCKHLNEDSTCKKVNHKEKHLNKCLINSGAMKLCLHKEPEPNAFHKLKSEIWKVRQQCHSIGIKPDLKIVTTADFYLELLRCPEYNYRIETSDNKFLGNDLEVLKNNQGLPFTVVQKR